MEYKIGMKVSFGRPNGEKTVGKIVKVYPKKLSIKQTEVRGRQKTYSIGTIWTVPKNERFVQVLDLHTDEWVAEDRWLECRWCGEKNNELCDCISCLGCYEIALDETTTCPMDDDICSGCCTEPCCYHSEEAYIDLNAEDEEEIDDEDYWEPYLEALEELNGEIGQYVNYASSEYVGIVECISLWQNVAEDSAHTLSYVANKVHKFKMDAFRYIWEQDVNYVWENLSSETRNLLENFNPEDRYYEGDVVFKSWQMGWPNLSQLKDTINPYWLQNMEGQNYSFDLYR